MRWLCTTKRIKTTTAIFLTIYLIFLANTHKPSQDLLSQIRGFCPQLKLDWKKASFKVFDFLNRTFSRYETDFGAI